MGAALRVAGKLQRAVDGAGQKVVEGVEAQTAAISQVVIMADEGAAEFKSRLPVVLAGVVREVGEVLPVRVEAVARDGVVRAQRTGAVIEA